MSCFWGHSFGRFEIKERGNIHKAEDKTAIIGFFLKQERQCWKCGYVELDFQAKDL